MECLKKQESNKAFLDSLKIKPLNKAFYEEVKKNFDTVAKPLDGLGEFEKAIARIGAIKEKKDFSLDKRALIIMCSDNGIVEEKVTQSSSEVTLKVAKNMLRGKSSVAVMAKKNNIDCFVFDVGIASEEKLSGIIDKKIRKGTRNFAKEPAMTCEEVLDAINVGIETVGDLTNKGYDIITLGEMGIGNTTTSSAICAALLKLNASEVTGRGAGLDDESLNRKIKVIEEAIKKYNLYDKDPLDVLQHVGGYDLAALTGACIGAAINGIPVVIDGAITQTAVLLAKRLIPEVTDYIFASHKGREISSEKVLKELNLNAVISADMALGEGSGAVMFISLLDDALCVYKNAARFDELEMNNYERF